MKHGKLIQIAATTSAVLMTVLVTGTPLAAQEQAAVHQRYRLVDLGTLGGPNSYVTFTPFR